MAEALDHEQRAFGAETGLDRQGPTPLVYANRELSWLDFNERVLAQAQDDGVPLLERLKFLAIFDRNLDEFFQVRVAGLKDELAKASPQRFEELERHLASIRARVVELVGRHRRAFDVDIRPLVASFGLDLVPWNQLSADHRSWLEDFFETRVFPVLTPLAVDPAHPFPHISDLSLNLAVITRSPGELRRRFARVKIPPILPRFILLPGGRHIVAIEDVVSAQVHRLFTGTTILDVHAFRITRNAGVELAGVQLAGVQLAGVQLAGVGLAGAESAGFEQRGATIDGIGSDDAETSDDDVDDLLEALELQLHHRVRDGKAVRLEVELTMPVDVVHLLERELELEPTDIYRVPGLLAGADLWSLAGLVRSELTAARTMEPERVLPPATERAIEFQPWSPVTPPPFNHLVDVGARPEQLFAAIRANDALVHHPYESFTTSVEAFIQAAANDSDVLAIKQTLYRTSVPDSPVVTALIDAARAGKQVVALVELKARFDEQANIDWARKLERAGVHVVYGLVGLKTHAKLSLVVRREGTDLRRYVHIGTGNYNPNTATIYEDLGVFSADPALGADVTDLFNVLTGYSQQREYRELLVAPMSMREQLVERIDGQAHRGGRIVIKVNGLVDRTVIDALYAASKAGAEIDLIVRSMCCLVPGVPGLSDRIRVRSIVGRFLEHSRIYRFGGASLRADAAPIDGSVERAAEAADHPTTASWFIGSADLMPRNLDRRIETLVPIRQPHLGDRLDEILRINLADVALAWELDGHGRWHRRRDLAPSDARKDAHVELQELANRRVWTAGGPRSAAMT